jgi:hypothetical protein
MMLYNINFYSKNKLTLQYLCIDNLNNLFALKINTY